MVERVDYWAEQDFERDSGRVNEGSCKVRNTGSRTWSGNTMDWGGWTLTPKPKVGRGRTQRCRDKGNIVLWKESKVRKPRRYKEGYKDLKPLPERVRSSSSKPPPNGETGRQDTDS